MQTNINREAGTMGRGVPEISLVAIKNNSVILDLRYGVAYRAVVVIVFPGRAVHG